MGTPMTQLLEILESPIEQSELIGMVKVLIRQEKEMIIKAFEDGRMTGSFDYSWADGKFYYTEMFEI
jgi:hypothetical protein